MHAVLRTLSWHVRVRGCREGLRTSEAGRQATMSSNIQRPAGSIVEVLRHRAHHQGEQLAYAFLRDGEALEEPMTYGLLDRRARTLAAMLLERARPGERVLIVLQPGLGYIAALFACFYARLVAVPSFPPRARRLAGTLSATCRHSHPAGT